MSSKERPEAIHLTEQEVESLKGRIEAGILNAEDKKLMLGLLSFCLWLQRQLESTNLTLQKLKSFFGFSTEKKSL